MKTTSRLAVAAAAGLLMSGAAYAGGSVGGNCCADLEERVAELEATTARKGNRAVSLTVYGQVNKAIVFFDSTEIGREDTQIIDNDTSESRFGFKGKARISADVYAGYKIEFGLGAFLNGDEITIRHNDLYIGSKTYGKFSIGQGDTASNGISEIDLSGTVASASDNLSFSEQLDGDSRQERIRYDSPTLAGFKVSTSWQDNDDWDVALRYAGSWGNFTFAAGVAYLEEDNGNEETISGSASLLHVPTGLNLTVAGGEEEIGGVTNTEYWYVKVGIKRKYFSAGTTAIAVDYHWDETAAKGEGEKYRLQIVQKIDAAAMDLYLSAWSYEDDSGVEDDAVMIGTRIKF